MKESYHSIRFLVSLSIELLCINLNYIIPLIIIINNFLFHFSRDSKMLVLFCKTKKERNKSHQQEQGKENQKGTNPEELVGAAHSGCYSMFLAALISGEKLTPESQWVDKFHTINAEYKWYV